MSDLSIDNLCQVEFQVSNLDVATAYYKNVFGWGKTNADVHGVVFLEVPRNSKYGVSLVHSPSNQIRTSPTTVYFRAPKDGMDNMLALVEKNGGRLLSGPIKVPGRGVLYRTSDPYGNCLGLVF